MKKLILSTVLLLATTFSFGQISTPNNAVTATTNNTGTTAGNVGIGTTIPQFKLDVNSNSTRITTNDYSGVTFEKLAYPNQGALLFSSDRTGYTFIIGNKLYTNGSISPIITLYDTGNVGIGTTTPGYKLDIYTPATVTEAYSGINLQSSNFGYLIEGGLKQNAGGILKFSLNTAGAKSEKFRIDHNGNVGIGSANPDQKLTVKGKIHAEEIIVDLNVPADYVFQKYYTGKSELKSDYVMSTLTEIESFTKKNNHLPNVPSAKEMQKNGLSLGEMSNLLLQKVEELTLYAIEQNKVIEELKAQVATLSKENK